MIKTFKASVNTTMFLAVMRNALGY